jgi:alpha-D-ribose 1-methylphosphonate 5-triphosphate synthase subunit PhnG
MSISTEQGEASSTARRKWMAVLARSSRDALASALDAALDGASAPAYEWLRAPDIGLAMVRGRVGGTGDAFNLGEVTVTRATLRVSLPDGSTQVGVAVHMGRDKERARLAALADALLQSPSHSARMQTLVIEPLAARIAQAKTGKQTDANATKVEFFTMVRGE